MAKAKHDQLRYSVEESRLSVMLPDESDTLIFDVNVLKRYPEVMNEMFVHLAKKLLQERTSDAKSTKDRFDQMALVMKDLERGNFKKPREGRAKMPDWLKGHTYEIRAIAELMYKNEDDVRASLADMDERQGCAILTKPAVVAKAREYREAARGREIIDLSEFEDL